MALAKTARGVQLLVLIGDGAATEAFVAPCTINTARGIEFAADTNDVIVPDCDDPDLMAWTEREKRALSAQVTGEGVLNTPDAEPWTEFFMEATPRNCKVVLDVPSADGGIIWAGKFLCTNLAFTGDRGDKVQGSITLQSSGGITVSPNT